MYDTEHIPLKSITVTVDLLKTSCRTKTHRHTSSHKMLLTSYIAITTNLTKVFRTVKSLVIYNEYSLMSQSSYNVSSDRHIDRTITGTLRYAKYSPATKSATYSRAAATETCVLTLLNCYRTLHSLCIIIIAFVVKKVDAVKAVFSRALYFANFASLTSSQK